MRLATPNGNKPQKVSASSGHFKPPPDEDVEKLMEMDIPKAVKDMDFPQDIIRQVLKEKLEQTGLPFFKTQQYINAVLHKMEACDELEGASSSTHTESSGISQIEEGRVTAPQGDILLNVRRHERRVRQMGDEVPMQMWSTSNPTAGRNNDGQNSSATGGQIFGEDSFAMGRHFIILHILCSKCA